MKKVSLIFRMIMVIGVAATSAFVMSACDDEDEAPGALTVQSITASGTNFDTGEPVTDIDLFGATAADDVPLDATIVVTFNKPVDPTTVSGTTISVTGGATPPTVNTSVSGSTVTVTFDEDLERGTDYTVTVSGVKAEDGVDLQSTATATFGSAGRGEVTPPQAAAQQIYTNFDGSAEDQMGNYTLANEAAVTYGEDRFGQAGSAAYFDGDETIVEYADGVNLIGADFTLSTWIYVDTVDHFDANGALAGMFVFGIGNFQGIHLELHQWAKYNRMKFAQTFETSSTVAGEETTAEDFTVWDLNGTMEDFETNRGADFENTVDGGLAGLMVGKWAHLVYVYSSAENKRYCYINGVLQRSDDFDNATIDRITKITSMTLNRSDVQDEPTDADYISDRLALGFTHGSDSKRWATEPWGGYTIPTAQHFKGAMDDFRVFNAALTGEEVSALYDDEKP